MVLMVVVLNSLHSYMQMVLKVTGAYVRIYIDGSTPSPLSHYCDAHPGMGQTFTITTKTTSKVYLTTVSEHGFADNTNFYFVNTVSPKILEIQDPTATAPDGRPYVDEDPTSNTAKQ